MLTETALQRLGFIRYLYSVAVEQSRQLEPFGCSCILTFHDSVELLLQLAAESKGIKTTDLKFMDYWEALKPHLSSSELPQKEGMRLLNKIRVDLKHIGILPSKLMIEAIRANVTSFFEEATPLIFNIDFDKISLTYLIQNTTVRTFLDEASELQSQGSRSKALDKVALAFAELMQSFRMKSYLERHQQIFSPIQNFPSLRSSDVNNSQKLQDFLKETQSSIKEMKDVLAILSLGLDYQQYAKFKFLTPIPVSYMGSEHFSLIQPTPENPAPSFNNYLFCFNFVISSAIRIQSLNLEDN